MISFMQKITGADFASLAGKNPDKLRGDTALELMRIIHNTPSSHSQLLYRVAENIVLTYLKKQSYPISDPEIKNFNILSYNHFFDSKPFSTTFTVKAVNLSEYDKIAQNGRLCDELEAIYNSYISNRLTAHIIWIFFDEKFNPDKPNYKNIKKIEKLLPVNKSEFQPILTDALNYYISCLASQSISEKDISEKYLNLLDCQNGINYENYNIIEKQALKKYLYKL